MTARHIEDPLMDLKKDYYILFITHTLRQAKRISDYALSMYMRELVENGSAYKMFSEPKDVRTRKYMEDAIG